MELLWIVLAPFLLAMAAPALARLLPRAVGWLLALPAAIIFLLLARHTPQVVGGEPVLLEIPWVAELDIALAFHLDGLSLLFALLISGIGAFVLVYAGGYLAGDRDLGRFYAYLLAFMGSMLGVVLADDLIALFVFWELTSLTSFFLIGYYHEDPVSRRNALQALLVTAAGGLALLAGLLLLSSVTGTMRIHEILAAGSIFDHPYYTAILILVLAGAFTKSAQFPFHFWLPNAMAAPTPVSAYLHSATMVKAGVYLLARMNPVLGGTLPWQTVLVLFGGATMLLGAYLSFRGRDLKLILAYTTVSALGTLVMLIGIGTPFAIKAFVVFLLAHALYKGAFFLIAGAVDHETGTRDINRLGGLARSMPVTTVLAAFAGLSLASVPPLFSFIAKETLIEAALDAPALVLWSTLIVVLSGIFFVAVALKIAYRPFFGPPQETPKRPHEAPLALLLGPAVLTVTGLLFGLVPHLAPQALLASAAGSVHAAEISVHLELWHGFSEPLLISLLVVVLGALLYLYRFGVDRFFSPADRLTRWGPEAGYHRLLAGLLRVANRQTRTIQTTHIRHYFSTILFVAAGAAVLTLLVKHGIPPMIRPQNVALHEAFIAVIIIVGALFTAVARSRLGAVISLGLVGYGIALVFILYGAPDLALTQFLFETLIVLLFTFVLVRMPRFAHRSTPSVRLRDLFLSVFVGLTMVVLTLAAVATRFHDPISLYFAENSYLLAKGHNVVNVILVDFRGLDTLGEIVVIAVAGIGTYALLAMRRDNRRPGQADEENPPKRPPPQEEARS